MFCRKVILVKLNKCFSQSIHQNHFSSFMGYMVRCSFFMISNILQATILNTFSELSCTTKQSRMEEDPNVLVQLTWKNCMEIGQTLSYWNHHLYQRVMFSAKMLISD